ncbi:hypothetical protein DFH06DRAFT_1350221 [Mycena polygramma]|nr:hypothetical protein DFH06DRAFT_1350221 [Mycena polygramma]
MPGPPPPYSVSDPQIQQGNAQVDALTATVSNLNLSGRTRQPLPVGNRPPQTPTELPGPCPVDSSAPWTTTEWSEASHLTQGVPEARVRSVVPRSPKKRPKNRAYAVFYGIIPGVYLEWYGPEGAEVQVSGVPGSLYRGYPFPDDAEAAYEYARDRNWTGVRTRRPRSYRAPPSLSSSAIEALPVPTPLFESTHNPLHGPVDSDNRTWYIVYAGITPGVYLSHLECALNIVGLPGASHDSTDSLSEARRRWAEAERAGTIRVVTHPYY